MQTTSMLFALALATLPLAAHADAPGLVLPGADLPRAQRLVHRGRALTIAGLVQLAAGGALIAVPAIQSRGSDHCCGGGTVGALETVAGSLLLLGGTGLTAAGIPTWAIGARNERRAEQTLSLSVGGVKIAF